MRPQSIPGFFVAFVATFVLASALMAQTAGPDITTWQVNPQHTGNNASETILTPANVGTTGNFGLLFTQVLDGQTYGQPLFLSAATLAKLPGSFSDAKSHNVVYVATEHNSIYAFDADADLQGANPNGTNSSPLWKANLTPAGATTVPQTDVSSSDILIELGITTTPVIDPVSGTIYVVAKVKNPAFTPTPYKQFLHALDVKTGLDKPGSPVVLDSTTISFDGTPFQKQNDLDPVTAPTGKIPFSALHEHLRSAMVLSQGILYLTYASHSDTQPYYGEILAFDASTLKLVKTFIATPNSGTVNGDPTQPPNKTDHAAGEAGIWQGGASPAIDDAGNLYFITGNGAWDQNGPTADWGESVLKLPVSLSGPIQISQQDTMDYFTPHDWQLLNDGFGMTGLPGGDRDLGGGGLLLLPDQPGNHTHLMVGGGKAGTLYLLDRDNLGGINANDGSAIQEIVEPNTNSIFNTPAFFNGSIYYAPGGNPVERRTLQLDEINSVVKFSDPPQTTGTNDTFANKGATVFISSNGTTNGIVWAVKSSLEAYDATNLSNHIFSSRTNVPGVANSGCTTAKFTTPTVTNGKAYLTCFNGTTNQGYLFAYGLFPAAPGTPAAPTNLTAQGISSSQITLSWTNNVPSGTAFAGFTIMRATSSTANFSTVGTSASNSTSFTDTGLAAGTTFFYKVVSTNSNGNSLSTNVASGTTFPLFQPSGLVAYWPMDDGPNATSVVDVTGNGHTATIPARDEALFSPEGYIGGAWAFHGTQSTDELIVADSPALQFTASQSFTLSAWVKVDNLTGAEQPVLIKSAGTSFPYGLLVNAANRWVFRGANGDLVGPPVTLGVWTNLALVQDALQAKRFIYVNGVQQSQTAAAQEADSPGTLIMGEETINNVVSGFQGEIDDARLYNIALPPATVTSLLAPPVLEAASLQAQGTAGTFGVTLYPGSAAQVESRVGSVPGSYTVALHFPVPVTGITATLGVQQGATQTAVGQVSSVTYDSTQTVATVALTGVQNVQALNLHLANFYAVNDVPGKETGVAVTIPGTADIPFNVLQGDVSGDRRVDQTDLNAVTSQVSGIPVTQTNAVMDVNCDGLINAQDLAIIQGQLGKSLNVQTDVNLALFKTTVALSTNAGNVPANAVDGIANDNSRWESTQKVDPEWLYIDLGASAQIDSVDIDWQNASAKNYVLEYSNDQTATPANWLPFATITNNPTGGGDVISHPQTAPAIGRFVRMTGTVRNTAFGYSIDEFRVFGFFVSDASTRIAPSITSSTTASGVVGSSFSYQITASQTPTSFGATGLPAGLSVNAAGLITGTPTTSGTTSVTITATNATGTGSGTLTITISAPVLQPPANLSAVGGTGQINLTWSASTGATTYSVFRGTASGVEAAFATNLAGTSYADTAVTNGTKYFYFVKAVNSNGSSTASNEVSAMPIPPIVVPSAPTGLTAIAGDSTVSLTWNASTGATSYNVLRGTTAGGENAAPIASNLTSTTFTDTTATNGTTYFYKVTATNTAGVSAQSNEVSTTPAQAASTAVTIYQIDAGSAAAVGSFSADQSSLVSGGTTSSTTNTVNTAGVAHAAPMQVYQTNRFGTFTYTIPALVPGNTYTVYLHFAETYFTATNQRVFDVTLNGLTVLSAFDIVQKAGGANIAVVQSFTATANSSGQILIGFIAGPHGVNNPQVNGIEIVSNGGSMPPPTAPTGLFPTGGNKQVSLSWTPGNGPTGSYQVSRGTTPGGEASTPIASGIAGTYFIDTTVTNLTTYYYTVKAMNAGGISSASNEVVVVPGKAVVGTPIYQIAAGSTAAGTAIAPFALDADFAGGNSSGTGNAIDTTTAVSPAPLAVYQHERSGGTFTYTLPNLTPGAKYTVRLHFAEFYWTAVGKRVFNVAINGLTVLPHFDIVATAGAANKAVIEEFTATADSAGNITVQYSPGSADQPKASAIEIYQ
ncbi:malectin domain-containing carbohydrate-binding protein [Terriglobus saanensis]|uniref:Coagulation factor 5/8 type domain protein n=1 Tax=Terriglobus saanensis (strain ATCC BAA-1853 / DSM 23119 / SP1PR4) TaxID=401053 RepID=E8V7Y0_TERSS|nr:malectin domain-containing carbohydrate-binding protein [Terriglobus saanensis]ADV82904.1 coagulation factor 5/8 type domain protein [Terriglobus saanensis SP1PR4]